MNEMSDYRTGCGGFSMAISRQAIDALSSMGEQFGLAWQANARKTRGTDEVLNICIGDGYAPTKIDGWIHACTLTTKAIIKYAADKDAGLDIVGVTSWSGGNSAPGGCADGLPRGNAGVWQLTGIQ
jgi:hypothetical protein